MPRALGVGASAAAVGGAVTVIRIPLQLVSVANLRDHWRIRARRTCEHRLVTRAHLRKAGVYPGIGVPAVIHITRIAPRRLDSDNLAMSAKAVRDEVAACIGIDDGDPSVSYRYEQRSDGANYAVEIEIMEGTT